MEKTILIAENEAIVAIDLKYILEKMGYDVLAMVHTGEEAIEKVRETIPAILITSVHLSGKIDGIETVKHIRNDHHMPVVYITSHSDSSTLQIIKKMENAELILKPFSEEELSSAVEHAFRKYHQGYQTELLAIS
jgi:DNA-binding NtrC family response regulator